MWGRGPFVFNTNLKVMSLEVFVPKLIKRLVKYWEYNMKRDTLFLRFRTCRSNKYRGSVKGRGDIQIGRRRVVLPLYEPLESSYFRRNIVTLTSCVLVPGPH